jgi:RNA polymerase sporulation-specific sigma factor
MINYNELNDNELISISRECDENAMMILHKKYKPLIDKKCNKYIKFVKNKGVEFADLVQECLIAFEESIKNYNLLDDVTFYTFTNVCMDRKLNSLLVKLNRDKYKFLNEAIPMDPIDVDKDISLIYFIGDNKANPEMGLMEEANYEELYDKIIQVLTDFEECVFNLKLQNFDYKEIADIMDKDSKSIDNALQRIKVKIRKIIEDDIDG